MLSFLWILIPKTRPTTWPLACFSSTVLLTYHTDIISQRRMKIEGRIQGRIEGKTEGKTEGRLKGD